MRQLFAFLLVLLLVSVPLAAQSAQDASGSVPRLITITGVYHPADGKSLASVETVTLSVYADQQGGAPLFQETQQVTLDDRGRYSVVLGAAHADGIPPAIFTAGGQWLGTVFERPGEVEAPRVRLTSVPYAMRAAEADTLGGHPASDYVLANSGASEGKTANTATRGDVAAPAGTANFIPKYVDTVNLGDSALYDSGGMVGLGTTTPFDVFHVRYTNTGGNLTGFAVQNLGNTATSYSGMLFYDQNGALGQFQGFNNVTHEYRINNIATNGASQFDGSINFMVGSTSRFYVRSNGNIGIGTTTPSANLEVSNALFPLLPNATTLTASYGNTAAGSVFVGRKARGTAAAPTQVLNGDGLVFINGRGFGTTTFGGGASILMRATENYTDTAMGGMIQFSTTPNGTTGPALRMTINQDGNVGIGTTNPGNSLEVVRDGNDANIVATSFGTGVVPGIFFQSARGTAAAPTAVQSGDVLGVVGGNGYGATNFGDVNAAMGMVAAENWTDTAHGTGMGFLTTPLGSATMAINLAILPDGKIGMGTPLVNGFPTAADRLQVWGDVRVGTAGTNGCLKDFSGAGIAGTCSSDRRLKKNITPFEPVLDRLIALQPVHYFWRASEFPDRHFGDSRADGLIAQDVEQILPDLVVTDSDGYKAVNYSKLPLLTIQAMKELKAENDTLKEQVAELEPLKHRVAELERMLTEMLAASGRR